MIVHPHVFLETSLIALVSYVLYMFIPKVVELQKANLPAWSVFKAKCLRTNH